MDAWGCSKRVAFIFRILEAGKETARAKLTEDTTMKK